MATFKVTCPDCGQRVSGDESFLGTTVPCPVCNADIRFPDEAPDQSPAETPNQPPAKAPEQPPAEAAEQPPAITPDQPPADSPEKPASPSPAAEESESSPASSPDQSPAEPASPSPVADPQDFPRPKPRQEPALATPPTPAAPVIPAATTPKPRPPARTSSAAVWSTILGITAWVLCPIGLVFAIPAVVTGHAGRGNIQRSLGKLRGQGLATSGLALGYLYIVVLFFVLILGPWKPIGSFALQRFNEQTAHSILAALNNYADDNGRKYPPQLEDLTPDYLSAPQFDSIQWIDPGSSLLNLKREPYSYYPGHTKEEDPNTILISSPYADGAYRRLVGYINGTIEIFSEEEFIRRTIKK